VGPSAQELAVERTLMALDRTQMAWIRTALSMLTFGFSVVKFFQFLREEGWSPDPWSEVLGHWASPWKPYDPPHGVAFSPRWADQRSLRSDLAPPPMPIRGTGLRGASPGRMRLRRAARCRGAAVAGPRTPD
jgi:hypothetical protein